MECSIPDCHRPARSRTWCGAHYERWRCHGSPDTVATPRVGCTVEECEAPHYGNGLCRSHWGKQRRRGTTDAHVPDPGGPCSVDGCEGDRLTGARGYCRKHYQRVVRHGTPDDRPRVVGTVNAQGYRVISVPGHPNGHGAQGRIPEHRYVMAEHLGRALLPGENVHHLNGDRLDNRLENLELWVSHQPKGQRVPDLVEWARVILERYDE